MSAMTEQEWSHAWQGEQDRVDRLRAGRGSWLPNVVEVREWGAIRWTSGRPRHAADSGQAVAETFVVVNPERKDARDSAAAALRDPAPIVAMAGFTLRPDTVAGAVVGAAVGLVLGILIAVLASLGPLVAVLLVVVLVAGGAAAGAVVSGQLKARGRAMAGADTSTTRTITGRYAPDAWRRLVVAATTLEAPLGTQGGGGHADEQSFEAVHQALWEAAGLLRGSSDHTGVDVLADGVERLADAHGY